MIYPPTSFPLQAKQLGIPHAKAFDTAFHIASRDITALHWQYRYAETTLLLDESLSARHPRDNRQRTWLRPIRGYFAWANDSLNAVPAKMNCRIGGLFESLGGPIIFSSSSYRFQSFLKEKT